MKPTSGWFCNARKIINHYGGPICSHSFQNVFEALACKPWIILNLQNIQYIRMIAISHFLIAKFAQITCLQELQFSRQIKYLLRYIFLETNQISITIEQNISLDIHTYIWTYIFYLRKKVIEAVFDCTWIWDLETCHQYGHLFLGRTYSTSFCVPFLFGTSLIQTLD